jgi:homoisocitrate dehydrogenase
VELCVIEGDGVGREVIPAAVRVLKAVMPDLTIYEAVAGYDCLQEHGTPLPQETIDLAVKCRAVLFGAADSPSFPVDGYFEPIFELQRILSTYANVRPTVHLPVMTARPGVNIIIIHGNTEELHDVDHQQAEQPQTGTTTRVITRNITEHAAHKTYQFTRSAGHEKVTIVHRANILPQSDGLFRRVALEVAGHYPDIETDELLVDTAAYWMVKEPTRFDVILTTSMYGDILSDMAAAWGGGLGLIPTLNLGDDAAIAQPVHGAAPDIAGQNIANPIATILSGALLFQHHWGKPELARKIRHAVRAALNAGYHTIDIDPENAVSTEEFTTQVIEHLA